MHERGCTEKKVEKWGALVYIFSSFFLKSVNDVMPWCFKWL